MSTITGDQAAFDGEHASAGIRAVDVGMFIVRLALGIIFIAHGGQKVFGWFGGPGLAATVTGFTGMGIPAFFAYLASFTEFFGGVAVLIGLLSRLGALGLAVVMIVAVAKVHFKNGFFLGGPTPGYEYNIALVAMALAIAIGGPGRIALSDWEARFLRARRAD